ncbi:major facilitator superfamily domain-containing protein [Hyaloraphidium curvatum]|nr:major facilitator superfamily domain-containing protein [Hyaloraphidium curvatum]
MEPAALPPESPNSVPLPAPTQPLPAPSDASIALASGTAPPSPPSDAVSPPPSPRAPDAAAPPDPSKPEKDKSSILPPGMKMFDFVMVFVGLVLAVFLAALDQTIIGTAIPSIVTEFKSAGGVAWIGIAYFLTAVPFIPTYGKLSDIVGRKPVYLIAITLFELGSLICGLAPNMPVLIVGRAVAGLGGGAIFSMALIIIADYVPLEKRGLFAGLVGACFALASVAGPLLGGVFTQQLTWRWCFFINLPIGALTVLTIAFFMKIPRKPHELPVLKRLAALDWIGTALLSVGVICFLTGLTSGGVDYAWNSAFVISFLCVGAAFCLAFVAWEARGAQNGVLPPEFYAHRFTLGSFLTAFLIGSTFFGLVYYTPIYLQVANGQTPTQAGVSTLPLVFGVVLTNLVCGATASVTGLAWPFIPLGGAIAATGAGLMSTLNLDSSSAMQVGYLLIAGMGVGCLVQMNMLVAQGSTTQAKVAVITANMAFWQNLGAVVGIAVLGAVYNNALVPRLREHLPPGMPVEPFVNSPALISKLPPEIRRPVQQAYVDTLGIMFLVVVGTACAVVCSSMLLKKARLTRKGAADAEKGAGGEGEAKEGADGVVAAVREKPAEGSEAV